MQKLIPLLLVLFGVSFGISAGVLLKPEIKIQNPSEDISREEKVSDLDNELHSEDLGIERSRGLEYLNLKNQFVVPVVKNDRITSMVVTSLSLEISEGYREEILEKEPKLRNEFLRVLFDHANIGGFNGDFTRVENIETVQNALLEVAQKSIGRALISDVLIFEIARQDY